MNIRHLIIFGTASLFILFAIGCSQHSGRPPDSVTKPAAMTDSEAVKAQLEKIQKDFGVTVDVHGSQILIGTPGLETTNTMNQIRDALHKVFGDDFTNYTIVHIVS
jgi:hypothetical protein